MIRIVPPGVMPEGVVVHEHLILGAFPFVSALDLIILVELHRLVLVHDELLVVRLQIGLLLLELVISGRAQFSLGAELRLVELRVGRIRIDIALPLPFVFMMPGVAGSQRTLSIQGDSQLRPETLYDLPLRYSETVDNRIGDLQGYCHAFKIARIA